METTDNNYQVLMSYMRFEHMTHGHGWRTIKWQVMDFATHTEAEKTARELRDNALTYHIANII